MRRSTPTPATRRPRSLTSAPLSGCRAVLTPRWLLGHALVWLGVAAFLGLGWWQAGRAAEGNTLSWAYTFEWPLFALFLIILWIREMRVTLRALDPDPQPGQARRGPVITRREADLADDSDDPQLAAYNRYLEEIKER